MTITVEWDDTEQSIVRATYLGRWTWEEFFTTVEHTRGLLSQVEGRVDMILDMRESAPMPDDLLARSREIARISQESSVQIFVLVSQSSLLQIVFRTYSRLFPRAAQKYRFVSTLEDARALIAELRQSKPDNEAVQ